MGRRSSSRWEEDLRKIALNYCDQVRIDTSGKHIRIFLTGPQGDTKAVFASSTPSDHRTLANTVKQVKQVAAAVGAYR
jgi:hypothetical protein